METSGCTEVKAIEIVNGLLGSMEDALIKGDTVLLSGIGTIKPKIEKGRTKILFGKEVELEKKFKLTLNTSRAINEKYKGVSKVKITPDFKQVGDLFLSKNK